jgi:hypothetical protein
MLIALLVVALLVLLHLRTREKMRALPDWVLEQENYWEMARYNWPNCYSRELRRREGVSSGTGMTPWTSAH